MSRVAAIAVVLALAPAVRAGSDPQAITAESLAPHLTPKPGRALLVHLWASWCRPCIAEWPHFAKALRELEGRSVDIVVVSIDEPDAAAAAGKVLEKAGSFPGKSFLLPPDAALAAIGKLDPGWQGAVPTTLIVDGEGRIILAQRGATRLDEMASALDRVAPVKPETK